MRMFRTMTMLSLAVFILIPSLSAEALPVGTVDVVRTGHGANYGISVYGAGLSGDIEYTGVYMLDKTGGTGSGDLWDNGAIPAFCIEVEEPAPNLVTQYDVISPADNYNGILNETLGTAKADYLSELWGRYYDPSWEGSGPFTPTQNMEATAFAAAVWEIVYEDLPLSPLGWDVGSDGTPGIPGFAGLGVNTALANGWLASLDGTGPMAELAVFSNDGSQNFLVAVPEPMTLFLLGLGGAMSVMHRRRRIV